MVENKVFLSAGHGDKVSGAIGYIDEHKEAVRMTNRIYEILGSKHAYKYIESTARTQRQNLANIVNAHNVKPCKINVSIHFNASADPRGNGTETWYFSASSLANKLTKAMCNAQGTKNRGDKKSTALYFLRNTKQTAVLLEVGFVTNKSDSQKYKDNFEDLCQAIAGVLANELGVSITSNVKTSQKGVKGTLKTKTKLNYYDSPRWTRPSGVTKKGDVFTVVGSKVVDGYLMYKLKSGNWITGAGKYVDFTSSK